MISTHVYSATLVPAIGAEVELAARGGRITLDVASTTHVEADLDIGIPAEEILELLDPRTGCRIRIEVDGEYPSFSTHRVFDLGVRDRDPQHADGICRVRLASDDAQLDELAQLVDDETPLALTSSLRAIVDYVLSKLDGSPSLEAGGPDVATPAAWESRNHIRNPRAAVDTSLWVSATSNATLTRAATGGPNNTSRFISTATVGAGGVGVFYSPTGTTTSSQETELRVTPGQRVRFAFEFAKGNANGTTIAPRIRFSNGTRWVDVVGPTYTPTLGGYQRGEMTVEVPAGMTSMAPWVGGAIGVSWPVPSALSVSEFVLTIDEPEFVPYYDGAKAADALYTYSWDDTAHSSSSRRTPLVDAPREARIWDRGQTAMDFLYPLMQAAGMRLVCDELRRWTLRDEDYSPAGAINIRYRANLIDGADTISRGSGLWFTDAIAHYKWRSSTGVEMEAFDTYSSGITPAVTKTFEFQTAYPGPGFAAYAVRRAQGRGREVTATCVADWRAIAEQSAQIVLPGVPTQIGSAQRVEYDLDTDRMTVSTRTVDTPDAAWLLIDVGERWTDSPAGESWTEEVI